MAETPGVGARVAETVEPAAGDDPSRAGESVFGERVSPVVSLPGLALEVLVRQAGLMAEAHDLTGLRVSDLMVALEKAKTPTLRMTRIAPTTSSAEARLRTALR